MELLLEGTVFGIYALRRSRDGVDHCPALEFINRMTESSRKSMLGVLRRHADFGPILNEQKSRQLRDDIYEFKSRQGDRLLWFYSPSHRGLTIITHGFHKGARLRTEIERAIALRLEYLQSLG